MIGLGTMAHIRKLLAADFADAVTAAVETLASGGIVIFPTETVYGIGVDAANREAVARLRSLKGRDADKPFQLLIADVRMGLAMGGQFSRGATHLADQYWPGPLTLIVPDKEGGTLGLRIPDHGFALAVIKKFGRAVATSSANPGGQPPPVDAGAADVFGSAVDLLVDGGVCAVGTASTVVLADKDGGFDILREGAITRRDLATIWDFDT
jgi:Sua5/YciO/YrdC/YwlC family protein